jgi:PKD repeat protein
LTVSLSPTSGYTGDTTAVSITLRNGIEDALNVERISVKFDWDPTTWSWGSMSLAAYGSDTNTRSQILASTPGDHLVRITVRGQAVGDLWAEDCTATRVMRITALPPPPSVLATANPTTGAAPLTVAFSATVSYGLEPFTYRWTFGDGSTASGPSVVHTYRSPGTYTIQLVVTDARDRSDSSTVTVTVTDAGAAGVLGFAASNPRGLLAIIIIVIAAAVGITIALTRHKRAPPPQPPG